MIGHRSETNALDWASSVLFFLFSDAFGASGDYSFINRSNCCFFSLCCREQSHSLEWSMVLSFLMNR